MDNLLLLARLFLASVFLLAGVSKLFDGAASAKALREFGVPASLATPLAIGLPSIELVVGISLVSTTYAWWGALGALTLLLAFIIVVSINLAYGRTPNCRCFGRLSLTAAGLPTLIRNEMLAAVAGLVMWQGWNSTGLSVFAWLGDLTTGGKVRLLAGLAVIALLSATAGGHRFLLGTTDLKPVSSGEGEGTGSVFSGGSIATARTESFAVHAAGLPVGSTAPEFNLSRLYGGRLSIETLRAYTRQVMLVFVDPACGSCKVLLPEISRWQAVDARHLAISVIVSGDAQSNRAMMAAHGLTEILLQEHDEVAQAYKVVGLPTALIILADGTIGSRPALGGEAIRSLVTNIMETRGAAGESTFLATPLVTPAGEVGSRAGTFGCRPCPER